MMLAMTDHVERNRREWNRWAENWVEPGRHNWSVTEMMWGTLEAPEKDLGLLGDVAGKHVLELGCGTAYFSSWLVRRGAHAIALDVSERQLETALFLQSEFGISFPLLRANAEQVPDPQREL
jgi:2-polyprenyl-3-methyl-5-hydroxy-6-metoxy-1,4-benzoquinol methylase